MGKDGNRPFGIRRTGRTGMKQSDTNGRWPTECVTRSSSSPGRNDQEVGRRATRTTISQILGERALETLAWLGLVAAPITSPFEESAQFTKE